VIQTYIYSDTGSKFVLNEDSLGRKADHSPPSSSEAKNMWSYTSTPPYFLMAWCLVEHWDDVTLGQRGASCRASEGLSCSSSGSVRPS